MLTILDVLHGIPDVYIKEYDPDNDPVGKANAATWTDWEQFQLINKDGVTFTPAFERTDINVPEFGLIDETVDALGGEIMLQLKGVSLEALQYAFPHSVYAEGEVAGTNPNTLSVGTGNSNAYFSLGFERDKVGSSPETIVAFFPKVKITAANEMQIGNSGITIVQLNFRVFIDPEAATTSNVFKLYELTVAAE